MNLPGASQMMVFLADVQPLFVVVIFAFPEPIQFVWFVLGLQKLKRMAQIEIAVLMVAQRLPL
jgi:hypothetical protein